MPQTELGKVVAIAREIADDVIARDAEAVDRESRWPEAGLRALQERLGGLTVPARLGGLGHGLLAVARVCETIGRYCASTGICFGMHTVATAVLAAKASPDQEERYLGPIARGEHLTTLALSEPGTGVEFWLPQTRMARTEDGLLRLHGTKSFVTNGGHADSYVVGVVAAEPDAPPGEFSVVVVDGDASGLAWQGDWQGFGMRGSAARTVRLQDVPVPAQNLLGKGGDQIWYVFNVVTPYFLMAMAGTYLGVASAAVEDARQHLRRRSHVLSGPRLSQQDVPQHRLGTLWAQVERTRRLIYHAAADAEAGGPEALLGLCSAKAEAAECAVEATNEAMTLVGGIGYREGSPLQRYLRDARAAHVMSPPTDLLRVWVGRALLDEPLLGRV